MIIIDPNKPNKIFFISKLKIKQIIDSTEITKKIYQVGACLVKKETNKTIGKFYLGRLTSIKRKLHCRNWHLFSVQVFNEIPESRHAA